MNLNIARWQIEHDPGATKGCYEHLPAGWGCDCLPCRNFAALGRAAYPLPAHELFERLGIDYLKPAEVYHSARLDSGLHLYGGFFHFVGHIESGADAWQPLGSTGKGDTLKMHPLGEHFDLGFSSHLALVRDSFSKHPVVQLEFSTELPWVLEAEEPRNG